MDRDVEAPSKAAHSWLTTGCLRALPVLRAVIALVATGAVVQLVLTSFVRTRYPFELEWMEGAVVDHIRVVLAGEPLYREPSLDFTPFIYTPFYYYLATLPSRLLGVGFFAPRLLSTLAMMGNLALIASLVRREGAGRLGSLVAVGLFAVTFQSSGFWMDLTRVDSLFTLFFLAGAYFARHGRSQASAVACGVALFLSFFTKQTGLTLAIPILAGIVALDRRRGALAAAVFGVLCVGAVVWMNRASNGWFGYYVFEVPRHHDIRWGQWRDLLVEPFWRAVAVPLLLSVLAFFSGHVSKNGRAVGLLYAGTLGVAFLASYSSLMHSDGFANVLIPYYAVTSLLAGIGADWVLERPTPEGSVTDASTPRLQVFALVALCAHFGSLAYDHRRVLPKRHDVAAGKAMIAKLAAQPGPILMLGSGYYGALAGHREINAHTMALTDVFKTRDAARTDALMTSMIDGIQSKRFKSIVVDPSYSLLPPKILEAVNRSYRRDYSLFEPTDGNAAFPKTGYATRPQEVWVLKTP